MNEEKPNQSMSTLKVIVAIVIVVALWPVIEVFAGIITTLAISVIGMGLVFVLFIAIVYPFIGEKRESGNIERNIRDWISRVCTNIKEAVGNKGDEP